MRNFQIHITGETPLLMHADNIDWADSMTAWKDNPANKSKSKAGDDRTPAWRWLGHTYNDGKHVVIPSDNIMRALMQGGAMVPVPGAKGNKTFKSQSQSGMVLMDGFLPLCINDQPIQWDSLSSLVAEDDFDAHKERAEDLGFSLQVKRAKVGTSKHIRVRPLFNNWSVKGQLGVWDEQLTDAALQQIFDYAGDYKGLCDWRPGGSTPGPYGRFKASVKRM